MVFVEVSGTQSSGGNWQVFQPYREQLIDILIEGKGRGRGEGKGKREEGKGREREEGREKGPKQIHLKMGGWGRKSS